MDYCFTTRCRAWTIALLQGVEHELLLYYEVQSVDYCFITRCRAWTIALLRGVERGLRVATPRTDVLA